jgi:programmed cell death protein 5
MDNNLVNPNELPEGFSLTDPNNPQSSAGAGQHQEAEFKRQAVEEQKQMILEQSMDSDALARLGRIKLVKPSKAVQIENSIVSMAMSGKLPGPITEAKLVEILERTSRKEAISAAHAAGSGGAGPSGINIQRKKYSLDSDDDDDDDDDDV